MGTERGRAAKVIGFAPFSLRDREGREGGREGIMFRLFLALFVQRSESQFIRGATRRQLPGRGRAKFAL